VNAAELAAKIRADITRESAEITAIVLRETADRFERECPDADGSLDLCMCHAADVLREWADEADPAAVPASGVPLTAEELASGQADVDHLNAEFPDEPQDGNGWPGDEHAEPGTRGWTV